MDKNIFLIFACVVLTNQTESSMLSSAVPKSNSSNAERLAREKAKRLAREETRKKFKKMSRKEVADAKAKQLLVEHSEKVGEAEMYATNKAEDSRVEFTTNTAHLSKDEKEKRLKKLNNERKKRFNDERKKRFNDERMQKLGIDKTVDESWVIVDSPSSEDEEDKSFIIVDLPSSESVDSHF